MGAPRIGSVVDGFEYVGGDHRNPSNWRKASVGAVAYDRALSTKRANADAGTFVKAQEGLQSADNLLAVAGEANALRNQGVQTGGFGELRKGLGQKVGNAFTSGITGGFIPDKAQTAKMERFDQLSKESALGDVAKLKGPLSDRDIQLLKDIQFGLNTSDGGNKQAIAAREFIATRQKAYEGALQAWASKLGSPSATNANGQSFDSWFSGWAGQNIPFPTGGKFTYRGPSAQRKGAQAPAARPAAQPAPSGGYKILQVEE